MILNEKPLVKLMNAQYKGEGYTVIHFAWAQETWIGVTGDGWAAMVERSNVPRKVLAAIVEHAGDLPGVGQAWMLQEGMEPQNVAFRVAFEEIESLLGFLDEVDPERMHRTALMLGGYRLWQNVRTMQIWKLQPALTNVASAEKQKIIAAGSHLCMRGNVSAAFITRVPAKESETNRILYLEKMQWA